MDLEDCRQAPSLKFLGDRDTVINAMRFSTHPVITAFLEAFDSTAKSDRRYIPLQLFALKADVDFSQLVGAFVLALQTVQAQKSAIVAMTNHPEIVEKTVKFAREERGEKDRRMLHEAVRFLPTGKGISIIQNFGEREEEDAGETETAPDVNDLFPLINTKQEGWQSSRKKLLEE